MATSLELQDVQQGILRKKNIDEANFEAAAGTTVAEYTEELIERAETSTQPVLIMFDAIIGKVPSSASLDVQAALAQAQFDDYAAKGVANPELGPYEALGRSLSSTAGFAAQSDGLEDGQFITNVYVKAFGVTPGTAQVDHFQDQITYFTNLYTGSGIPAAQAALQARGAVYGQIFGIAATVEDSPLDIAAENFLRGTVTGTAIYDAPLSASQPASPDPDVQTVDLTPNTDSGLAFSLGEGADTFNAQVQQTAFLPIQTLNSTDNLDGGADRDTLNAQLVNAFTVPAGLKGIEVLNIEGAPGFITPPVTLDVVNADSIDTIGFRSPTNNVTINNLKTALQEINISDETGGLTNTINHVAGALAGDDELNINLSNVGQGGGDVHLVLNGVDGYDTFNVSSTGGLPNEIDVKGSAQTASTVNIAGDTDLNINGEPGNGWNTGPLDLLDASTFSGKLDTDFVGSGDVTVHGGTKDDDLTFWVTGGAVEANGNDGDDTIRLGVDGAFVANVTKATLSGGEGNDTLSSHSTGPVSLNGDAGDDVLTFAEIGGAVTFSDDDAANGGDGNDLLVIEADNNSTLLAAGVGAKITGIETIRHIGSYGPGDINLAVNMAETGSANVVQLFGDGELGGASGDYFNVAVTNMTNDQTLEVADDINGELSLSHSASLIQTYRIQLDGGVNIDDIDDTSPIGETDAYFFVSVGGSGNSVDNIADLTADVGVSGTQAFTFGSAGARYSVDNGLFSANTDAGVFTGNLAVWTGAGHQTVVGGAGGDTINVGDGVFGGDDLINLSLGGNDTVFMEEYSAFAFESLAPTNTTHVTGWSDDTIRLDRSNLGGIETANNVSTNTVTMQTLSFNDVANATGTAVNYVKLTTTVLGAADANALFDAAIGGGTLGVAAGTDNMLITAYDDTNDQMVIFTVDTNGGTLSAADNVVAVVGTVSMSAAQYAGIDASNFVLQA